jgi:LacI family transcriptional regulator
MAKITMKEVAKLAGVSQPTVSRVINNNPKVDPKIKKRVLDVINEVGYRPNKTAQTLKNTTSKIIGVSMPNLKNPYYISILDNIESQARANNYNIMVSLSRNNPKTEQSNLSSFLDRQVDGVMIIPIQNNDYEFLKKFPVPVLSATWFLEGIDSVAISHYNAGVLAAENLYNSGHTNFAVAGYLHDEKIDGFISGFYSKGITFNNDNFIEMSKNASTPYDYKRAIEDYLSTHETIDASCILATNDQMAFELKKLFESNNINNCEIIGFDDTDISRNQNISSVHQPIEEISKNSFELLLSRINKEETKEDAIHLEYDAVFIKRG